MLKTNWALLLRPASCSRTGISVKRHETILASKADQCPRPPSSLENATHQCPGYTAATNWHVTNRNWRFAADSLIDKLDSHKLNRDKFDRDRFDRDKCDREKSRRREEAGRGEMNETVSRHHWWVPELRCVSFWARPIPKAQQVSKTGTWALGASFYDKNMTLDQLNVK
jgi:hypothetical protein